MKWDCLKKIICEFGKFIKSESKTKQILQNSWGGSDFFLKKCRYLIHGNFSRVYFLMIHYSCMFSELNPMLLFGLITYYLSKLPQEWQNTINFHILCCYICLQMLLHLPTDGFVLKYRIFFVWPCSIFVCKSPEILSVLDPTWRSFDFGSLLLLLLIHPALQSHS